MSTKMDLNNTASALRILDGGMGKYLISRGLPASEKLWASTAIVQPQYHAMLINAHIDYLRAGCNIITTNNYSITPKYLQVINSMDKLSEWTKLSVVFAKKARSMYISSTHGQNNTPKTKKVPLIAGSVPPLMKSYREYLRLNEAESIKYYTQIVQALHEENVDIFLCETMSCIEEALWILQVLRDNQNVDEKTEIMVAFALNDDADLRSNESINEAIKQIVAKKKEYKLNVSTVLMNCCLLESVERGLQRIVNDTETVRLLENNALKIGMYPNAMESIRMERLDYVHSIRHEITPQIFYHRFVKKWLQNERYQKLIGVVGGCCGIEPKHMQYITENAIRDFPHLVDRGSPCKSKL